MLIIAVIILMIGVFYYPLRSYLAMGIYNAYNYSSSIMKEKSFVLDMKGGLFTAKKDWYPLVNIYDTSYEFSNYINEDLGLTVLYNFGAFDGTSSSLYNESSDYFAAFYGAYAIAYNDDDKRRYGFNEDGIIIEEISLVPMFDYRYLVVEDLGRKHPYLDLIDYKVTYDVKYLGYDGWVKIDANMQGNSPSHKRQDFKLGYIQYGKPLDNNKDDFYDIDLSGRMYARYFDKYSCTIVVYVMGANDSIIDECDNEILQHTKIYNKE